MTEWKDIVQIVVDKFSLKLPVDETEEKHIRTIV